METLNKRAHSSHTSPNLWSDVTAQTERIRSIFSFLIPTAEVLFAVIKIVWERSSKKKGGEKRADKTKKRRLSQCPSDTSHHATLCLLKPLNSMTVYTGLAKLSRWCGKTSLQIKHTLWLFGFLSAYDSIEARWFMCFSLSKHFGHFRRLNCLVINSDWSHQRGLSGSFCWDIYCLILVLFLSSRLRDRPLVCIIKTSLQPISGFVLQLLVGVSPQMGEEIPLLARFWCLFYLFGGDEGAFLLLREKSPRSCAKQYHVSLGRQNSFHPGDDLCLLHYAITFL